MHSAAANERVARELSPLRDNPAAIERVMTKAGTAPALWLLGCAAGLARRRVDDDALVVEVSFARSGHHGDRLQALRDDLALCVHAQRRPCRAQRPRLTGIRAQGVALTQAGQ